MLGASLSSMHMADIIKFPKRSVKPLDLMNALRIQLFELMRVKKSLEELKAEIEKHENDNSPNDCA